MLAEIVKAGQVVEIQSTAKETEENKEELATIYRSKVFDILSEDQLEILMPMEKTKLILLPIDGSFDLCFYTDSGLYQCFAKVIDRYKSNNVYVVVMELTSNLRKFQRREYYRFSCGLEMHSRQMEPEEIKAIDQNEFYIAPGLPVKRSLIINISGGGMRFIANYSYDVGSMIYCNYTLLTHGQAKEYQIVGKVLSAEELDNRPGVFEHRLEYVNVDEDVREEIIKYIFEEEIKKRRKEQGRK